MQVEKDLLQSSLNMDIDTDVESFHSALKRLLLAYARWNTQTGYCQGFIIPAAVILLVMGSDEEDALKVLVYLLDQVLPHNYFANSISALTVDVTVFHELLKIQMPELSQHLEQLCRAAKQAGDGRCVLPLHTVVSMHWFLTLFTSCLPKESVLRIFDAIFFEGSEVLLCVALAIWAQLEEWIKQCQTMDEVSQQFGREMMERNLMDPGELMQAVYAMTTLPFPKVKELREKFSPTSSQSKFTASSGRLNESSVRRNPSSETNGHCTFLAAVGYSQAQNPQNCHKTAQGQTPRSSCDVTGAAAGESVPGRDAVRSSREQPVAKQRPCKVPERQRQRVTPKHGRTDPWAPGTPLHSHKTKGISSFLGGQTLKKSRKSQSCQVPHDTSPSTALLRQKGKNKLTLGWRSQKVSRKGLSGNKKAKSGCSDTVSLLEDQTDCGKAESPREDDSIHVVVEKSRKTTGICWERIGKYGKQLTCPPLERDVDNLAGVGNLFKALQIVEQCQYSPAQNHSPLESSTGLETEDFMAPSHAKKNPANALPPRYLICLASPLKKQIGSLPG
ncbi:TBC1 domain family member 30-like [Narcine bancroftii]|uniref:TBC1 domain family member 30-like n=1 Tax=Narcine bancroftii TaxID=1343680 RepID=UPI0038313CFB